ncbi:MAG: MBL fold metallo-hydrolase [Pseudolabrys sp.]
MAQFPFSVRFWGVRGSIPCPGPATLRYGGNTCCVEIRCGDRILIFDAGTGIRPLGASLVGNTEITTTDIFFSHCHIDHLIGLPFFEFLHHSDHQVRLWGGQRDRAAHLESALRKLLSHPLFPIELEALKANLDIRSFSAGETITPHPGITLRTAVLNHPGGATGYRIEYDGRSIAYLTDLEMKNGQVDDAVLALAKDAALVIVDATYTDDEVAIHAGWGHSSWQQVVAFGNRAGARKLCLFHHDPEHDDDFMDRIAAAASKARPGTIVSREGLVIDI